MNKDNPTKKFGKQTKGYKRKTVKVVPIMARWRAEAIEV